MGKAVLHSLIDLLNDADTETIYRVLIKFVPEDEPFPDEILAVKQGEADIASGDISDFDSIDWEL